MPRLNERLLDCAAYLYGSEKDASNHIKAGGSGFLLGVPLTEPEPLAVPPIEELFLGERKHDIWDHGEPFLYVVTNRHVIEEGYKVVRLNTQGGKFDAMALDSWVCDSASDLAIHLIPWTPDHHLFACVPFDFIMSKRNSLALDVGVGDDVFSIGRFVNHEGTQRNLPVARFGNIAMAPKEPVMVYYRDKNGALRPASRVPQESFLIESHTVPGYSGSPVFLRIPPWELREFDSVHLRRKIYEHPGKASASVGQLLGVTWGFIWGQRESVLDPVTKKEIGRANLNSGMAGVVPGWQLLELLNCKELIEQRNEKRRLLKEQEDPPGGVLC